MFTTILNRKTCHSHQYFKVPSSLFIQKFLKLCSETITWNDTQTTICYISRYFLVITNSDKVNLQLIYNAVLLRLAEDIWVAMKQIEVPSMIAIDLRAADQKCDMVYSILSLHKLIYSYYIMPSYWGWQRTFGLQWNRLKYYWW